MNNGASKDSPGNASHDPEGRKFGRYVIHDEIGRGGMGVVYKAYDPNLGRFVALKVLSSATTSQEDVARFNREAHAIATLRHLNIVTVHDVGTHIGMHFYAMELLEGESLDKILKQFKRLPPPLALKIIAATADAVDCAHQRGILHRDVKPANIFLELPEDRHKAEVTAPASAQHEQPPRNGKEIPPAKAPWHPAHGKDTGGHAFTRLADMESVRVVLTDFGLARDLTAETQRLTASGALLGTPHYMSPEQAARNRQAVGVRSDVYSLGATLYEALTGKPPFSAPNLLALVSKIASPDMPESPSSIVPHLPRDVATIVMKAIAKDPLERYATAGEFRDDMTRYLRGEPIAAKPPTTLRMVSMTVGRHKVAAASLALFAILVAAGIFYAFMPSEESGAPSASGGGDSRTGAELRQARRDLQAAESLMRAGLARDGKEKACAVLAALDSLAVGKPGSLDCCTMRARALRLLGRREEAVAALGKAIGLLVETGGINTGNAREPSSAREHSEPAQLARQLSSLLFERGRLRFQLAMDRLICHKVTALFGSVFHAPDEIFQAALNDFSEMQRFAPETAQVFYACAARSFVAERYDPQWARQVVLNMMENDPKNEAAWLFLAQLDYFTADYAAVLKAIDELLALHRGLPGAHLLCGLAAMWEGDLDRAQSAYEKELEISVEDPIVSSYALLLGWWCGRLPAGRFWDLTAKFPQSHVPAFLEALCCLLRPQKRADWQNLYENIFPIKSEPQEQQVRSLNGVVISRQYSATGAAFLKEREEKIRTLATITPRLKKPYEIDSSLSAIPAMLGMAAALKEDLFNTLMNFNSAAKCEIPSPVALLADAMLQITGLIGRVGKDSADLEPLMRKAREFDSCPANLVFTRNLNSRLLKGSSNISLQFADEPLESALEQIENMTGLRIEIDPAVAATVKAATVTWKVAGIDIEKALAAMLAKHGLDCFVRGTRVVVAKADSFTETTSVSNLYRNTTLSDLVFEMLAYQGALGLASNVAGGEQQITKQRITVDAQNMTLKEFFDCLGGFQKVDLSPRVQAGNVLDNRVAVKFKDMELTSVLRLVLSNHGLDFYVSIDRIVVVFPDEMPWKNMEQGAGIPDVPSGMISEDVLCKQNLEYLGIFVLYLSKVGYGAQTKTLGSVSKIVAAMFSSEEETNVLLPGDISRLSCPACAGLPRPSADAINKGDLSSAAYEFTDDKLTDAIPRDKPIAWDRRPSHGAARHVLFANCMVQKVTEKDFQKLMMKYEKGKGKGIPPDRNTAETAQTTLKLLHKAQMDWRAKDIDANGVSNFWAKDVAGMYFRGPSSWMLTAARADQVACKNYPQLGNPWPLPCGYWLRAIIFDMQGKPLATDTNGDGEAKENLEIFGLCAYPAAYGLDAPFTYIINESGVVWKKDLGEQAQNSVDRWPAADPSTMGWTRER